MPCMAQLKAETTKFNRKSKIPLTCEAEEWTLEHSNCV